MPRLAYILAHRCREHLFHRDQLARLLTLYDHCVVVLGPIGAPTQDDGTGKVLEHVAKRHPSQLTVLTNAHSWPKETDAVRAALTCLRSHLKYERSIYLWRLEPWEVWELSALRGAEQELEKVKADVGEFLADFHIGKDLLVRGDWGEGRAAPYRRLWRWSGELCSADPLQLYGSQRSALLSQRFDSFLYLHPSDPPEGAPALLSARWETLRLRPSTDYPLPVAELLGPTGVGLTDTYLHHYDQHEPIPPAIR